MKENEIQASLVAVRLYKGWFVKNIIGFIITFSLFLCFRNQWIKCSNVAILMGNFLLMVMFIGWSATAFTGMRSYKKKLEN
jgi:energy-coupling factor transporter transmembrane protein EcfT